MRLAPSELAARRGVLSRTPLVVVVWLVLASIINISASASVTTTTDPEHQPDDGWQVPPPQQTMMIRGAGDGLGTMDGGSKSKSNGSKKSSSGKSKSSDDASDTTISSTQDDSPQYLESTSAEQVVIFSDGFETGWDGWMDGGADAGRIDNTWGNARTGQWALRLKDNTAESTVTKAVNVQSFGKLTLDFYFKPKKMTGAAESFHLDVKKDGGMYLPLKEWKPQDMVEGQ